MPEFHEIDVPCETLPALFANAVERGDEQTIFRQKRLGLWQSLSWRELGETVRDAGMGLLELGFAVGETAAVLGNTRQEWMFSDLAVLCCGGVSCGLSANAEPSEIANWMRDSAAVILFVEGEEQLDKILQVRASLPALRQIVVWDMRGLRGLDDARVISFAALRQLGRTATADEWHQRVASMQPEDVALRLYTAKQPEGVLLTHRDIVQAVRGLNRAIAQDADDERTCFLPLADLAERIAGAYFSLSTGTRLNFVENPETIAENLREIAPTVFLATPQVWEKLHADVASALAESTAFERWAYQTALGIGLKTAPRFTQWLASVLVLNNVRKFIGIHRSRVLISIAVPLSPELARWYVALGAPQPEVLGLGKVGAGGTAVLPPRA